MRIQHLNGYDPFGNSNASVRILLERGEMDDYQKWPMSGMTVILEAPDNIPIGHTTICTICKGQNLDRVEEGGYPREIARTIVPLPTCPSHLYIMFQDHVCIHAGAD